MYVFAAFLGLSTAVWEPHLGVCRLFRGQKDPSERARSFLIMSGDPHPTATLERSLWQRCNDAELKVRRAIGAEPGLSIFGTGVETGAARGGKELFVTLTAANEAARISAPNLLDGYSGLDKSDWADGWRRLQLGDWIIRVYPERDG
jgi:hypothetical protein